MEQIDDMGGEDDHVLCSVDTCTRLSEGTFRERMVGSSLSEVSYGVLLVWLPDS